MQRHNSERYISVIYTTETNASLGPGANAIFQYPAIYRFTCRMYIFYFPYDTQNCTLTFSSWVYDAAGIEYSAFRNFVTFESFVPNEEWQVLSFNYDKEVIYYNCCPVPWTLLHLKLHMKRKSLYYISNLVLPTGVITFIAIIGFFTPGTTSMERTEKVNLGISTLLAMSILLLMVSDQMPTTSNFVPLMGWFFLVIIFLISTGTLMTSLILSVQQQAIFGSKVPGWVKRVFFGHVAFVLWVKPRKELQNYMRKNRRRCKNSPLKNGVDHNGQIDSPPLFPRTDNETRLVPQLAFDAEEDEVDGEIENRALELEWEYLASILDRIFLIIFGFSVLFVTFGMLTVDLLFDA